MREFNLMRSEIKKAERFAKKRDGKDSRVTGYSCRAVPDELGFVDVRCEICSEDMSVREEDVVLCVFMPDRRRSFVSESRS